MAKYLFYAGLVLDKRKKTGEKLVELLLLCLFCLEVLPELVKTSARQISVPRVFDCLHLILI